jgi:protein gp37
MATRSAIEWPEMTWNPVTGCSKVSPGCLNCYAERMSRRLHAMGAARYAHGFELTTHADALDAPFHWKAPRKVFVNSMSDLFHKDVPLAGIHWVIVGGESGPGARLMQPQWVDDILAQCRAQDVPFFFKQWGGIQKHRTGRGLRGRTFDEMPRVAGAAMR